MRCGGVRISEKSYEFRTIWYRIKGFENQRRGQENSDLYQWLDEESAALAVT